MLCEVRDIATKMPPNQAGKDVYTLFIIGFLKFNEKAIILYKALIIQIILLIPICKSLRLIDGV